MGFLDFFKRKVEEPEENERESISFNELDSWICKKSSELDKERGVFLNSMKERTDILIKEIRQGAEVLENLNWNKIKAEEKILLVVKENLGNYIIQLKQLADKLEGFEQTERSKEELRSVFSAFDKKTGMNYQKATILIGKEMDNIGKSVSVFFKDMEKIHGDNKGLIDKSGVILNVREKLQELKKSDDLVFGINVEIKSIAGEIGKLENEIKKHEAEIEEVKKSDEYKEESDKRNRFDSNKKKLTLRLDELRKGIDFKSLARTWHENKPEMAIVKKYRENFNETFQKDAGGVLGRLINTLENKDSLQKVLLEVLELDEDIKNTELGVSPTSELEEKITKARNEIGSLKDRKEKEEKKLGKINAEREKMIGDIKRELGGIGVEVIS